jgi:hypothetical protein
VGVQHFLAYFSGFFSFLTSFYRSCFPYLSIIMIPCRLVFIETSKKTSKIMILNARAAKISGRANIPKNRIKIVFAGQPD